MTKKYQIGDHVSWNSEAGRVSGTIIKVHVQDFDYKGHPRRASETEPQYEIKSDKTDHIAAHKGSALTIIKSRNRVEDRFLLYDRVLEPHDRAVQQALKGCWNCYSR